MLTTQEGRDVVLCGDVADRTLFLDGVNALMTSSRLLQVPSTP